MKINFNIAEDLENISKEFFLQSSFKVTPEKSYFHQHCLLQHKLIYPTPRKVIFSKKFCVPLELEKGLENLVKKLRLGEDVNYYLSKGSLDLTREDGLLNDFGIYHFHLGSNYEDNFIKRTKEVAFVYINNTTAFFIEAPAHGNSNDVDKLLWFRTRYIKIIHNEQPHLIENFRINGIPSIDIDDIARKKLRKENVNTPIQVDDKTSYMSMGQGFVTSGSSARAIMLANKINNEIVTYALAIKKNFEENPPSNIKSDDQEIILRLINFYGTPGSLNTEYELWKDDKAIYKITYLYKNESSSTLIISEIRKDI
ncbi:hypothetical protein R4446_11890 [Acinetobacter baumannii]|nr:hypothetical protein [Acinetobacter baumannii]